MRGLSALGVFFVVLALGMVAPLLAPARVCAWTDATVRSAHAEIELTDDGRAHVTLWARVRVNGGWLEGLELEGLDEDAALDPDHPLTFRDANGIALPVEVTPREGGRVSLRFARRSAPRRGEYDFDLAWTTALSETRALDASTLEARWVFPAWRYGLDAVEIRWIVPAGTTAQPTDEITAPIEIESTPLGDGTDRLAILHRRAHLPRTSDWETLVRVPQSAWPHAEPLADGASPLDLAAPSESAAIATTPDAEVATPPTEASDERGEAGPASRQLWLAMGIAIAIAAWLKRRALDEHARRARRAHLLLVPTPRGLHALAALIALGLAIATFLLAWDPTASLVASAVLVALGWQRTQQDAARPRVLPLAPISAREIGRARRDRVLDWIGPSAWLDPARLGLATAIVVFAWTTGHDAVARLHAALFFALVASGTRARLGTLPGASVRRLAAAMSELRLDLGAPYVAVRLLGRGAEDATDARVYLSPSAEGASARVLEDLRMEIVDDDTHASRVASSLCLRVAAREDTPAELALRAWAESEGVSLHEIARRRAVLVPLPSRGVGATVERVLRGVLSLAPHEHDATVRDELLAAE